MIYESTWINYQPYKYGGKEDEPMHGLGLLDFHARQLNRKGVPYPLTMDPLCENYYSWSPYSWCAGNPIRNVDPTGCSTWVSLLPNGTFQVIGGDSEDDDLNIYAGYYNKDGAFVRGNSIGTTTSTTSFYDSYANEGKGDWAKESIIDPNDNSGDIFLQGLVNDDPSLVSYMLNATKGEKYDFKATNNTGEVDKSLDWYRGVPITNTDFTVSNNPVYTSAKDAGNIAAGYIAAIKGLTWEQARTGFDALQKWQDRSFKSVEKASSVNAQHYGFLRGQRKLIINSFSK